MLYSQRAEPKVNTIFHYKVNITGIGDKKALCDDFLIYANCL